MSPKLKYPTLALCTIFACLSVAMMFHWSEAIMHNENPFIRRYVQGCVQMHQLDLQYNSYYFAGFSDTTIFLGNTTGPLHVTSVDSALTKKSSFKMLLDDQTFNYRSPLLQVSFSDIYLIDGTVPVIYKGGIASKQLELKWHGKDRFSQPRLLDSQTLVCQTINPKTDMSELAVLHFGGDSGFEIHDRLLEKQIDGVFDSDGMLYFSKSTGWVVYTYYYRNQYIIAEPSLDLHYRGTTIDTVSKAAIEVVDIPGRNEKKLARPPVTANRLSAVDGNLLFVASGLIGQFEDRNLWEHSSIIDVYDIAARKYIASFYLYHHDGKKARAIAADNGRFYALIGNQIVFYRLDKLITKQYQLKQ